MVVFECGVRVWCSRGVFEGSVRVWCSSVVFEGSVRAWCSSVVFEGGVRGECSSVKRECSRGECQLLHTFILQLLHTLIIVTSQEYHLENQTGTRGSSDVVCSSW